MKTHALAALIAMFCLVPNMALAQQRQRGVLYEAVVLRVIDGDTVAVRAPWLPDPLKKELSVRVFGVDTPEKGFRATCEQEDTRARLASDFTKNFVSKGTSKQFLLLDWDKYGGRVLGDIVVDGKSLREELLKNRLAREYYGGKKQSWCNL